jgi:preprotein translocase subunit SecF
MFMDDEEQEMQYIQLLQQLAADRKAQRKRLTEWRQGDGSLSASMLSRQFMSVSFQFYLFFFYLLLFFRFCFCFFLLFS